VADVKRPSLSMGAKTGTLGVRDLVAPGYAAERSASRSNSATTSPGFFPRA
jgi:hypothetical protein